MLVGDCLFSRNFKKEEKEETGEAIGKRNSAVAHRAWFHEKMSCRSVSGAVSVRIEKCVLIGLLALVAPMSGLVHAAPAAHYQLVSHPKQPKQPRIRGNKIKGPFGMDYLKSKKQKPAKYHYRSPITGNTLYGKPVKH